LEKTKNDLEETKVYVNNLSIKLNGILLFNWKLNSNFKNFLQNLRFLLRTETKQELVKTRADFLITVDGLSAKLNGIYSYIGILDKNSNANIF
jgi:hypothetical protein